MAGLLPIGACCRACGYVLTGLGEPRCPECGGTFDPANPKTFDRSVKQRRWRRVWRPLLIGTLVVSLGYGVFPRGYVRGTLVYVAGGGEPQEKYTQWRLAPPRWMARVPYPRWTVIETGGQYQASPTSEELAGEIVKFVIESERHHWIRAMDFRSSLSTSHTRREMTSEQQKSLNPVYARQLLEALVRRQCWGLTGVSSSPDDSTLPREVLDGAEPW